MGFGSPRVLALGGNIPRVGVPLPRKPKPFPRKPKSFDLLRGPTPALLRRPRWLFVLALGGHVPRVGVPFPRNPHGGPTAPSPSLLLLHHEEFVKVDLAVTVDVRPLVERLDLRLRVLSPAVTLEPTQHRAELDLVKHACLG